MAGPLQGHSARRVWWRDCGKTACASSFVEVCDRVAKSPPGPLHLAGPEVRHRQLRGHVRGKLSHRKGVTRCSRCLKEPQEPCALHFHPRVLIILNYTRSMSCETPHEYFILLTFWTNCVYLIIRNTYVRIAKCVYHNKKNKNGWQSPWGNAVRLLCSCR